VGDANIRVNCICLAANTTPMNAHMGKQWFDQVVNVQAIKRVSQPHEVAETAVWLASDRAAIITGAAIANDLGATAGFAH
jgi:NAD(P)-dependent dehydrogenase (short-subunit alcohol dehydrogenase family)